mmetsp:Transcript_116062/g.333331  ORF Transcript_116062/g.333331 Transcript_116062/m.333331 type:complete len:377 (+) Transcript_116062:109-1239(+)
MLLAASLAGVGGLLWAFGVLGKRIGVEGSQNHDKNIRASCTITVYVLTTMVMPLVDFATTDRKLLAETFADREWVKRIPGIVGCGVISGFGGLLGTVAFAWSAGVNSALVSMVENGMYTIAGAVLIAIFFGERPAAVQYAAGLSILAGIVLAQGTSQRQRRQRKDDQSDSASTSASASASTSGDLESDSDDAASAGEQDPSPSVVSGAASDDAGSVYAPTALRKRAIAVAMLAGFCWGFGPVGKKYGVANAPEHSKHVWTTCTYTLYISSTPLVPLVKVLFADRELRRKTLGDRRFQKLLLGTMVCGLISGLGGLVSTLAFAYAKGESALMSVVENGVYTVGGALLIILIFAEVVTRRQIVSAGFVLVGLLIAACA